jgi:formate hydrogenlyase subunit 3/multisubunit Na+/H+ antiporter MnhD subunit
MKDLILIFKQLLTQHAWIKFALEIFSLVLAAGVLRAITLRLVRRWRAYLNWKHKNVGLALVERMITPVFVIAILSVSFNFFPLRDASGAKASQPPKNSAGDGADNPVGNRRASGSIFLKTSPRAVLSSRFSNPIPQSSFPGRSQPGG